MRESFVLYNSFYEPLKLLSEKQLGKLFKAIFEYQINGNKDVDIDIQMAFAFIKNQMDIDKIKYDEKVEKNSNNGRKGGRPPKKDNQDVKANGFLETQKSERFLEKAKKAYNDNDNDNDFSPYIPQRGNNDEDDIFDLSSLIPPDDGIDRNFPALVDFLNKYPFSETDKQKIVVVSDYGKIGHPVWMLINEITTNPGIKIPVKFTLSRLNL